MAKNKKLAGMSIKKATVNNKPQQSDNNKKASPTVLPERNKVELPKEINYALSDFYEDGSDLFLPKTGYAYQYAEKFKDIPPHQLRKVLDYVKGILVNLRNNDFKTSQKRLFVLLPMTAYNCGRLGKSESAKYDYYYEFMKMHISDRAIRTEEDIQVFDTLFTSIIAYHVQLNKKDDSEE